MLPYCRAPSGATAAPPAATPWLSFRTLTFARSSKVIFSAGLSSVFAIVSLSGPGRNLLLRSLLLRLGWWLRVLRSGSRVGWRAGSERRVSHSGETRAQFRLALQLHLLQDDGALFKSLLQRKHVAPLEHVSAEESQDEQRHSHQDAICPLYPSRFRA